MHTSTTPPTRDLTAALEGLRVQLLALEADGEDGLEGLAAHVLSALTSRHFRLARSGRQHGRDGATAPGTFDVFFEAKRYGDRAPSTENLTAKLMSAIGSRHPRLDLWIVVATISLGENAIADVKEAAERFAVTALAIDWSAHPLPPLAVMLASAPDAVREWAAAHKLESQTAPLQGYLEDIALHPSFSAAAKELLASLTTETIGLGSARAKNEEWLLEKLADRNKARQAFGQFITPNDSAQHTVLRKLEVQNLAAAVKDAGNQIVAVTGDEGAGKTWLAAAAWLSEKERPLLLLCTTDMPSLGLAQSDVIQFLASLLLQQAGGMQGNEGLQRWIRRLENWMETPGDAPGIWLVLDGLNERESLPWAQIIDNVISVAKPLGIRLIITSRPAFFQRLRQMLTGYDIKTVPIGPFSDAELDEMMRWQKIEPNDVRPETRNFLRNPRIFSIAASLLDRLHVNELRPERLLFEYWRKRREERRHLRHSDAEMRELLISHAQIVRQKLLTSGTSALAAFRRDLWKAHSGAARRTSGTTIDDELSEIESGAFFTPASDREDYYQLRPESFAYTLGLLVIDELRSVTPQDIPAQLESAIDPIRGYDLVADVLVAALGIACSDPECPDEVAAGLIASILGIQNLPDASANDILAYVGARPAAFVQAAELMWAHPQRRHARSNWLWWLLFERRHDDRVQPHLEKAVQRWLSLWSREPDRPRHWTNEQERTTEQSRIEELRKNIETRLSALSEAENTFLASAASEVANPELMTLDELALHLSAGLPLDAFVERIVAWHLLINLASRFFDAHESMAWVLRLNPNAEAIGTKLREVLDQLAVGQPSQTGLWTRYGVLRSTGLPRDAEEAEQITQQLTNYRYYPGFRRVERFCDSDPLDPSSSPPTNIEHAVEHVSAFDVSNLRKFMSRGTEDNDLESLTPALARFRPKVIIDKLRACATDLVNRSGPAARFLGFDLPNFTVLLTDAEVAILRDAFTKFIADPTTSSDSDQRIAAQYILLGLLPHLEAKDQLDALMMLPDGYGEMITLLSHFKTLEPIALSERLVSAEQRDSAMQSTVALRRTLFFASAGKDTLTDPARAVIARAFNHSNPVIRLLAFDAASIRKDEPLLKTFASSDWSALNAGTTHTEAFYGSKALACAPTELRTVDNLMRMTLEWQTRVIATWEDACVRQHAVLVIEQVRNTLGLPSGTRPEVRAERNVATPEQPSNYPYLATRDDQTNKPVDIMEAMRRLSSPSDDSEWKAEQKRQQEAISKYLRTLNEHDAQRLVDYAYTRGFATVAERAPDLFSVLVDLLQSAPKNRLSNVCNAIACVAVVLSQRDAKAGAELIKKISDVEPDIRLTIGGAHLPWHRLALWQLQDSDAAGQLRRQRLVRAPDDASLFTEVLCGAYAGKQAEILACATSLIGSSCPADIARGLMITGFCDTNDETPKLLNDIRFRHGFLGAVSKLSREYYERNAWARDWYNEAKKASDRTAWWRAAELMIDAADGRFVLWFDQSRFNATPFLGFAEFARDRLIKRAEHKLKKRADKLFGMSPPRRAILEGYGLTS